MRTRQSFKCKCGQWVMFKYADSHKCSNIDWYRWFLRVMAIVWVVLVYILYTKLPSN